MTVPKEVVSKRAADLYIHFVWTGTEEEKVNTIKDSKEIMRLTHALAVLDEYGGGKGYMINDTQIIKDEIRSLVRKHNIQMPGKYEDEN